MDYSEDEEAKAFQEEEWSRVLENTGHMADTRSRHPASHMPTNGSAFPNRSKPETSLRMLSWPLQPEPEQASREGKGMERNDC